MGRLLELHGERGVPEYIRVLEALESDDMSSDVLSALGVLWADASGEEPIRELLPAYQDASSGRFNIADYQWGAFTGMAWWRLVELGVLGRGDEDVAVDALDGEDDTVHVAGSLTVGSSVQLTQYLVVEGDLVIEGDLGIDSYAFYTRFGADESNAPNVIVYGNLVIKGSLDYDGAVILVGGDMVVFGAIKEHSDWSLVVVSGDVSAGQLVDSRGELLVGQVLRAPLISLTYNHGSAVVLGAIVAVLFHEEDHSGSWCATLPSADIALYGEMQFGPDGEYVYGEEGEALRSAFDRVLAPELFDEFFEGSFVEEGYLYDVDGDDIEFSALMYELLERLAGGTELFVPAALNDFENRVNAL